MIHFCRNNLVYYSDIGFQVTVVGRVPIDGSAPSQDLLVVQYGAVGIFNLVP